MFALEIEFNDGVSSPETLLVKRVQARVGVGSEAHVVIDGATSALVNLEIFKNLGEQFFCKTLDSPNGDIEAEFKSNAVIDLSEVVVTVTSLDIDLAIKEDESLDQAGIRVLKKALSKRTPSFPALALLGTRPVVVSFFEGESLVVGRSAGADIRVDSSDISSKHARIGYEDGKFWIEDLGSTNGTFIEGEKVEGRAPLENQPARLGLRSEVVGVATQADLGRLSRVSGVDGPARIGREDKFPCLLALSKAVKPERYVLPENETISLGRDPACDVWLGAGHISRKHLKASLGESGTVVLEDSSSNGTFIGGKQIDSGGSVELDKEGVVVAFGGGIEVAVCYSKSDEVKFLGQKKGEDASNEVEPGESLPESSDGVFSRLVAEKNDEIESELKRASNPTYMGPSPLEKVEERALVAHDEPELEEDIGDSLFGSDSRVYLKEQLLGSSWFLGLMAVFCSLSLVTLYWLFG